MELYKEIAAWTGWPPIVATLLVVGALIVWVFNNRIETLKEKTENLKEENERIKENNPDILMKRLTFRHKLLMEELENLNTDHEASQGIIQKKEAELMRLSEAIKAVETELKNANKILSVVYENHLVCPICEAPLYNTKSFTHFMDFDGKDIDIDYDRQHYECGCVTVGDYIEKACTS